MSSLFESDFIYANSYHRYRNLRIVLFTILTFFAYPFYYFYLALIKDSLSGYSNGLFTFLFYFFAFCTIIALILYWKAKEFKHVGQIKITDSGIQTHYDDQLVTYPFDELSDIIFSRGSTYHYEHQDSNIIIKNDNFIKFNKEGHPYNFEFIIHSSGHDEKFIQMIRGLRKTGLKFRYESI